MNRLLTSNISATYPSHPSLLRFSGSFDSSIDESAEQESCLSDSTVLDSQEVSSSNDMSPTNDSVSSSSSLSSLELDQDVKTNVIKSKPISRLINGRHTLEKNKSNDSLSTFVLDERFGADSSQETASSAPSSPTGQTPRRSLKSSLKLTPKRKPLPRSNSMPLISSKKSVKFSSTGLENVCFFNKHDTPLSVSAAPSSEEEGFDLFEDNDSILDPLILLKFSNSPGFSLDYDSDEDEAVSKHYWKIASSNFEQLVQEDEELDSNVRLENVWLSAGLVKDKKGYRYLNGSILVKNLSFKKDVSVKLTLNNWLSFIKVNAQYKDSVSHCIDRFNFKLNLDKLNCHHNKKLNLKLCLNYNVNNTSYWDNNFNLNYSVKLTKHSATKKSHRKQVSELNISILNDLLESKPSRYFPDQEIDVWFKSSPSKYSFEEDCSASNTSLSTLTETNKFNDQSYNDLVKNYCFYNGKNDS